MTSYAKPIGIAMIVAAVLAGLSTSPPAGYSSSSSDITDADGIVYRNYPPYGYRFQPLLSFGRLNSEVSAHHARAASRLATALVKRSVHKRAAAYWEYDFPFGGSVPWRSGFTQVIGAQALARAGIFLDKPSLLHSAAASFRGLRRGLLMRIGHGSWIREYSFTHQVILNAQLQSLISLESYARVANSAKASKVAREMEIATLRLLPRFDLGCWSRYELGGRGATADYHAYHVRLLRRISLTHDQPIWMKTYRRWSRCPAA